MRDGVLLIASLTLLAGCGGSGPRPATSALAPVADGIPLGALPQQALGKGECGLFLWKTGASARLVLMAKSGPPPFARLLLDGAAIDLPRLDDGGDLAQTPNARYGNGSVTVSIDVVIEPRRGLSDGALIPSGSIRVDRRAGDGFVVPATGLLACG